MLFRSLNEYIGVDPDDGLAIYRIDDINYPKQAGNRPPACGVPWKMAQLGKCVRATARQAAGGVAPESASLGLEPDFCPGGADKDGHTS